MDNNNKAAAESHMEIMVEAALAGHDFGPFEPVEAGARGYQAVLVVSPRWSSK